MNVGEGLYARKKRKRERERKRVRKESEAILQPDVNGGNTSKANFNKVVNSISGGVKNKNDFPTSAAFPQPIFFVRYFWIRGFSTKGCCYKIQDQFFNTW